MNADFGLSRFQGPAQRIGASAMYVFAAGAYIGPAMGNFSLAVLLMALVVQLPARARVLWREPLFLLAVAFLVYITWRTIAAVSEFPEVAKWQWKEAGGWATLWLFPVFGWYMRNQLGRAHLVLGLLATGFLFEAAAELDWANVSAIFAFGTDRIALDMTANAVGLYSAIGVWGSGHVLFSYRSHWRQSAVVISIAIAYLLAFSALLLGSQSRSAWLALLLVIGAYAGIGVVQRVRSQGHSRRLLLQCSALLGCVVLGLVLLAQSEQFQQRIADTANELEGIQAAVSDGDINDVPRNPLGYRIHMYALGLDAVRERPLLGWGPGTSIPETLAERSGRDFLQPFADLHNGFLVLFARLGLVGGLPFLVGGLILVLRLIRISADAAHPHSALARLLLGAIVIAALASLMNFRWTHVDFGFFWVVFGGLGWTITTRSIGEGEHAFPMPESR